MSAQNNTPPTPTNKKELREQYAGLAMQALVIRGIPASVTSVVEYAISFADALVEALERTEK